MTLFAGTSSIVITPPVGVELAGYSFGPSQGILSDLEAQVLFLESRSDDQSAESLVILTADLLAFGSEFAARLRQRVEAETGIPASHLLLAASHTHSGPTTLHFRQWGAVDENYVHLLEDNLLGAVRMARGNLQGARLGHGIGEVETISENRRGKGLLDHSVPVLRVDELSGKTICVLLNFGCHPVSLHSFRNLISPDYPGYTRKVVRSVLGEDVLVMFSLGAAGDINPKGYIPRTFTPQRSWQIGAVLGCETAKIALEARFSDDQSLMVMARTLDLPVEPLPSAVELQNLLDQFISQIERLKSAGSGWEEIARWEIQREWAMDGLRAWQDGKVRTSLPCEIMAVRLGQAVILAAPLELFTETGLAIKAQSPLAVTLVCSNSNGALGYLPTQDAYLEEDYTNPQGLAPRVYGLYAFSPEAEPLFRHTAIELLHQVTGIGMNSKP